MGPTSYRECEVCLSLVIKLTVWNVCLTRCGSKFMVRGGGGGGVTGKFACFLGSREKKNHLVMIKQTSTGFVLSLRASVCTILSTPSVQKS